MNILVIGSGGREHTLVWKISKSSLCDNLYTSPGNAGTAGISENVKLDGFQEIKQFCLDKAITMLVIGPEQPLVDGLADFFENDPSLSSIKVIGPKSEAAQLEGSKEFANSFMDRHNIPTASFQSFNSNEFDKAAEYLKSKKSPYVIKVDGLAAGKGVIIEEDLAKAELALKEILVDKKFGDAGSKVVIEDFLKGIELSVFILTDGKEYVLLPEAKDYKRIGEGDTGLNTGGMGAISPVFFADESFMNKVVKRVIEPTLEGLQKENIDYTGFIFLGLMNVDGDPYVIEYNCRLGDPETEVILPRLKSDLLELFDACADGKLGEKNVEFDERFASTVMLVSGGYPEKYQKGKKIKNIDQIEDVFPFHAGTSLDDNGNIITNGGRVIALTALGDNVNEALSKSNKAAELIDFDKKFFRKDIGHDLLKLSF